MNATGTGTLGRSYIFEETEGIYTADSHVAVLYPDENLLLPRFLQVFFSLPTTQETIYTDCVNGSTNQIELSKEKIALVRVPIPELVKQKQFVDFVHQSDKSKFVVSNRNLSRCLATLGKTKKDGALRLLETVVYLILSVPKALATT